jgi:multidrug efflux pump subunit AcrA (membrane-fusion protein)
MSQTPSSRSEAPGPGALDIDTDAEAADRIAYLEPALWKRLADADTDADMARAWLALQCQMIEGVTRGLLVLPSAQPNSFEAAASWPEGAGRPAALAEVAEAAMRERRGVARAGSAGGQPDAGAPAHIGFPVLTAKQLQGAVAISLPSGRADQVRLAMRQLQWGVAWIRDRLAQRQSVLQERLLDRSRAALDLLGNALEHEGFAAAAMATVTALATRCQCARVSVGMLAGRTVTVKVISHSAQFGRQMNLVSLLGAAMEEAIDQRCMILFPAPSDQAVGTTAHAELCKVQRDGPILTVPMLVADRFIGALTFERPPDQPFAPETIDLIELVASVVAPVLEEKRQNDRWIGIKVYEAGRGQIERLLGPGYLGRKLAALGAAVLGLFLLLAQETYQVDADARIEGLVRRAVVAPYDGFVATSLARAGDNVHAGDKLAALEDRDLVLERLKWVTERQQHVSEYDKALAARQPAQINVLKSQVDQADAQIKLIDEQLARVKLLSPIDGLVVSGDLSQLIGAAVQRGQVLFEIAPLAGYRVILDVDEREVGAVEAGQVGRLVTTALPNETWPFRVDKVTPIAEVKSGRNVFRVEGQLTESSDRLRPGMDGIGKIEIGRRHVAWVWSHSLVDSLRLWGWQWLP